MKAKPKAKNRPRASRLWFVTGWILIAFASLFVPGMLISQLPPNPNPDMPVWLLYWPLEILFLSGLQFLWIRRTLGISLRLWAPLAVLGTLLTELLISPPMINSVLFSFPPRPNLDFFMLYTSTIALISHSVPLVFQWPALRTRFQKSWLWLLAAVAVLPFSHHFLAEGPGGIFSAAANWLAGTTGLNLDQNWFFTYILDEIAFFTVTGIVLHYIITKGSDTEALRSGVAAQEEREADAARLAVQESADDDSPAQEEFLPELSGAKQLTSSQ